MAGKEKKVYVCSECGFEHMRWVGKCSSCGSWNTVEEVIVSQTASASPARSTRDITVYTLNHIDSTEEQRYKTGISELDRVLGGGIVKGSLILLGGDPGIGKSTLLLQICQYLGQSLSVLYISGEESVRQLKLRANRLSVTTENLMVVAETDMDIVLAAIEQLKPDLVIVDSIQTMNNAVLNSSPGSITQVRECTSALMKTAKMLDIPIFIVGHVNKDGAIAGPKVLEHVVDAVLYFEGDRHMSYRILRAVKNRYGSTNEIGVFEMQDVGLAEVENPSLMLLSGRPKGAAGTCVACVMEGTRPILAEVQGLAATTMFGNPRRMSTGFDYNRMSLILAVLEKRAGYFFSNMDAYVNVVGGLRLDEPAADLSVALAMISSLKDTPIEEKVLAFGEIGLTGEIRSVSHAQERVSEAIRLGFKKCILPIHNMKALNQKALSGIELIGVRNVRQAYECL